MSNPLKPKSNGSLSKRKKIGKRQSILLLGYLPQQNPLVRIFGNPHQQNHPLAQGKEKKRLAQEIRSKRENELIVQANGLLDKSKRKANFVSWYENYINAKPRTNTHRSSSLAHLKTYMGNRPLPFTALTPQWIKEFTNYLLKKMSNNTARCYLMDMFTALEDAVRQDIIPFNPFRKIEKHERIRQQNVFRQAFTLEQLQLLSETSCDIHPQIKQAYIFSCFTGLRWSDVNKLKWAEVIVKQIDDMEEYFIFPKEEKNKIPTIKPERQEMEMLRNVV